uniref:Guanylate cyclase 2G-like n=1 Tax=Saccoglossus kowalevskii TaxID=10224 RepID=A0ABM0M931_SACKO|nr:PREDICTED: guanylate cyclase 2G-like [Saccoglossus kowalevskii]
MAGRLILLLFAISNLWYLALAEEFVLVTLLEGSDQYGTGPYDKQRVLPAIEIAVDKINDNAYILPNDRLKIVFNDTTCDRVTTTLEVTKMQNQWDPDAFIGPACWLSVEMVSALATYWNIPVLSGAAEDPILSDREIFATLVRTYAPMGKLTSALLRVLEYFEVNIVGMLFDAEDEHNYIIGFAMYYAVIDHRTVGFHSVEGKKGLYPSDGSEKFLEYFLTVGGASRCK